MLFMFRILSDRQLVFPFLPLAYVLMAEPFFGNGVIWIGVSRLMFFASGARDAFSGTHNSASAISAAIIRIRNVRQTSLARVIELPALSSIRV